MSAPTRLPRGPRRRRLFARGFVVAGACLAAFAAARADDGRSSPCAADLESGMKLLAAAERGDASAAKRAWETFEAAERRCPEDVRFPFFAGLAHVYGEDPMGVESSLVRLRARLAIPLKELNRPEAEAEFDPHMLFLRAAFNFRIRRQNQSAAEQLLRARMRDPNFEPTAVSRLLFNALVAWGRDLESKGDLTQAIAQTLRAKEEARYDLNPKRRDIALRNLAQYYRLSDQWTDAQSVATDLVSRYPKDAVLRYLLASVHADQLDFAHAIEQWKVTLDLIAEGNTPAEDASDLSDAPMRYGISLASGGRTDEGLQKLREFAEKNPKDARPHFYLGRTLWDLGRSRDARDELEKAHEMDPLCPDTLSLLFTVYETAGADLRLPPGKAESRLVELRAMTTEESKAARKKQLTARGGGRHNDRTYGCR
jgi:tetratricopeptide (TPR) repeat protein